MCLCGSSSARWVDRAGDETRGNSGEARGRRRGLSRRARQGQDPGEAKLVVAGVGFDLRRTMLFEGEVGVKGTALVAEAREDAMRSPRSQRASRGGSSGGRAEIPSNDRSSRSSRDGARLLRSNTTVIAERTPRVERSIVRCCARSRAEQDVRVVETAETETAGIGCPARGKSVLFSRSLRAKETLKGNRTP